MTNPYSELPPERFWRSGIAEQHPSTVEKLYQKKFEILPKDRVATAGSCFAQHVARHMSRRGFTILDVEPSVENIPDDIAKKYGYNLYSGRYGNIYTVEQLYQLFQDATSLETRREDVWERNGRFFDAIRPSVEPEGLESVEEVLSHRVEHLKRVRILLDSMDVFVFTLGLTEGWRNKATGTVYPTCPGVIAGTFDPELFEFVNFDFFQIHSKMIEIRELLQSHNPNIRILLTVSPVPLTATMANEHVLVATTYSKSTLRSVCGALSKSFEDVDYFPSYELIASPFSKGFFYEANMRSVTEMGVDTVMKVFFTEHSHYAESTEGQGNKRRNGNKRKGANRGGRNKEDVVCEEALLEAFSR